MSFSMLLLTPLKFWRMCKNSLAKISGTPQFFIRHVNNTRGKWNCLWALTSRLTGRQGRCDTQYAILTFHSIFCVRDKNECIACTKIFIVLEMEIFIISRDKNKSWCNFIMLRLTGSVYLATLAADNRRRNG